MTAAVGLPVVMTPNDPAAPTVNVAVLALVMAGATGAAFTVRTKLCVAVPAVLAASMVSVYVPWLPSGGVPDRVAVPSPLSLKVTPEGRAGLEVVDIVAVGGRWS